MSIDLTVFGDEIDAINAQLQSKYSYHPSICNKVKDTILSFISDKNKTEDEKPKFSRDEVQEIGKLLIHENAYNYITYLRRNTFNDVIFRLMRKSLIESPYFNVPIQRNRELYAKFIGIKYEELLLVYAIDNEIKTLKAGLPGMSMDENLICSVFASLSIHGAMIYEGCQKDFLHLKHMDLDLQNSSLNPRWSKTGGIAGNSLFYRYFIPKISMICILQFLLLKRNKIYFRGKNKENEYIFPEEIRSISSKSLNDLFEKWTEGIARKYNLSTNMDLKRFRKVCKAYLAMHYPIALLSVQTKTLAAYSLKMFYFGPLLNIDRTDFMDDIKKPEKKTNEQKKDFRRVFADASYEELVKTIIKISGIRGKGVKEGKDNKNDTAIRHDTAIKIRQTMNDFIGKMKESGPLSVPVQNYKIFWEWLLMLLSLENRISSAATYTGSIGRYFLPLLEGTSILECSKEEMEEKALVYGNWFQKKGDVKKHFDKLFSFLSHDYGKTDVPKLSQLRKSEKVQHVPTAFMHFDDIDKVLATTDDPYLRCAIILGFYAGLRAGEITTLELSRFYYDGGYVLNISTTKTKNGKRNIPLYLIVPEVYLNELVQYYKKRLEDNKLRGKSKKKEKQWFFGKNKDDRNSSKMASQVGELFNGIVGVNIPFHDLRHSFANWFLIRCYVATNGIEHFDPQPSFLQNILFSDQYIQRMKFLLWGSNFSQVGRKNFSHALVVLARLIGHGTPDTTIQSYVHTIDFLMRMYLKKKFSHMKVKMTSKELADLLQVSYMSLPDKFKGRGIKDVNVEDIVEAQKALLGVSV